MNLASPAALAGLVRDTLRAPRPTFRRMMALDLPRAALWQALILMAVLSVIAAILVSTLPTPRSAETEAAGPPPFALFGIVQVLVLFGTVFLIHRIGRGMGGTGRLDDAILAVAWLQFILLIVQVVQAVLLVVAPGLAALLLLGGLMLFYWLLTAFVTELHGFDSMARVAGMIFVVLMGVALGLSFLLTLSGVTVTQ